jgi:exo-1,4-beta-D-glucosaminidase
LIDGKDVVANQTFASTGSWDTWNTVSVPVTLPAGDDVISVIFNSSKGSARYMNRDWIELVP